MRNKLRFSLLIMLGLLLSVSCTRKEKTAKSISAFNDEKTSKVRSSNSPKAKPGAGAERMEYFLNMLKDPSSNKIPTNIRKKELLKFEELKQSTLKSAQASNYNFSEAGPVDVGGRTRALAVDIRNSNTIIAGGVSGGIWKSTDGGSTWYLKNSPDEWLGITWVCQDTRSGHEDNWYYVTGEFWGNSASVSGADYLGFGVYNSADGGESWNQLTTTSLDFGDNDPFDYDDVADFISKVMVNPKNGILVLSVNNYGLMQYEDGKLSDLLGGLNDHTFSDFDFDSQGNIIAVLSEEGYNTSPTNTPGIYYAEATSLGFSSFERKFEDFPIYHERSLVRYAPSNDNAGYIFTHKGAEEVYMHKFNISGNSLTDLSDNLPNLSDNAYMGTLGPQGNYNMTLAVKPDDENFVVAGSTSLFRTNDGFSTPATIDYAWIGGFGPNDENYYYPNHHPDCHVTVFDPNNPDNMWSGHDGGLSYVQNVEQTANNIDLMEWANKNNGYNVTQFYTVANTKEAHYNIYYGGTQDNGTPMFVYNGTQTSASADISTGDGAYCYFGRDYIFSSSQNGTVRRLGYDDSGDQLTWTSWSRIYPSEAEDQLFVNPYTVDFNDENTMFYPSGDDMWINNDISSIEDGLSEGTTLGWRNESDLSVESYSITCLAISKVPSHRLYYGAYKMNNAPIIVRVDSAGTTNFTRTDIPIPEAPASSYPIHIAIDPMNADNIIVVFSNYNVPSIFYSDNGGESYVNIEGNLATYNENTGASIRSAEFVHSNGEQYYYVSTSIGLYRTLALNGTNTVWEVVEHDKLGNVVCSQVKKSYWDDIIMVATHGRGLFIGDTDNPVYIKKKIPNTAYAINTISSAQINLSDYFGLDSGSLSYSVVSNTNNQAVNAQISNETLDLSFLGTGESIIRLRASYAENSIDMAFSVHLNTVSTNIETNYVAVKDMIYPNPVSESFWINLSDDILGEINLQVLNLNGQVVYHQNFDGTSHLKSESINLSNLTGGVYIVQIKAENNTVYAQKIVKK